MTSIEIASTVRITLRVGIAAVLFDLLPAIAAGWWIARGRFRGKALFEAFVSLPLVLPPVAVGYLLLLLLAPRGPAGRLLEPLGVSLLFTW
ncbi:MAG: molybdate ABC transporter permease subunit, partial [Candidatus Eisenbacteria bacterium]|nr:molybdate ABC transporter permease subunit [Candidatus Eisenbacteria bacterium]